MRRPFVRVRPALPAQVRRFAARYQHGVEATVNRRGGGQMFKTIHDRLNRDEKGFTLIELMVVVLIIAILIAIAIPTFLGARSRAQDKQAQSNLRNALVTEDEFYTDNQAYSATNATMKALEPQLDWGNPKADQAGVVATLDAANDQTVILSSTSVSGTVFCL